MLKGAEKVTLANAIKSLLNVWLKRLVIGVQDNLVNPMVGLLES